MFGKHSQKAYLKQDSVYHLNNFFRDNNTLLAYVPIAYPLKTPKNVWFSGLFRGYKMGTLTRNGLKNEQQIKTTIK